MGDAARAGQLEGTQSMGGLARSGSMSETDPAMRSRFSILFFLCVLASLLVPGTASARTVAGAENRVWAFDLAKQVHVAGAATLTPELHQECGLAEYDCASGSLLAARGGLGSLGRAGSSSSIRVAEGGASAAEKLFGKLSKGGVDVTPPGHPGKLVRLPDGGFVGYRGVSKSGPPTIDVNIPGIDVRKIKFPE